MAYHSYHDGSYHHPGRRYEPNTSRSRDYDAHQPRYEDLYDSKLDSHLQPDMKYSRRRMGDYTYPSRHSHQPPLSRSVSYPTGHRRQATWPPFPTVEDLSEARAKEHDHPSLDENASDDAVVNRGSIDQEPVLLEVEEEMSKMNRERRFVLVPGAAGDADRRSDAVPIRKDAVCDDAHISKKMPLQKESKRPMETPPRPPSPYAYSKPDLVRVRSDSDSFLSPDARPSTRRRRPVPLQGDARRLGRSGGDISENSDLEEDEAPQLRSRRRPARYSFGKDQLSTSPKDSKTVGKDRTPAPYSLRDPPTLKERTSTPYSYKPLEPTILNPRDDPKERLSVRTSMPTSSRPDTPPKSTPFSTSSSSSSAGLTPQSSAMLTGDLPWSRPLPLRRSTCETLYGSAQRSSASRPSSRPASPLARDHDLPPSPPRSPMLRPKDDVVRSRIDPRFAPAPKQGSRNASRGGSPLSASFDLEPRTPRVESPVELNSRPERASTLPLANLPNDRSRPPSRHGFRDSTAREEVVPPFRADLQPPSARLPAAAATAVAAGASLPYPDDDAHQLMPSEEHFQFFPNSPQTPTRPLVDYAARLPATPITPIPARLQEEFDYARKPAIRRTYSDTDATRRSSNIAREKQSQDAAAETEFPSGPLPPCPRPEYTTKYNDWYTLDGALTLDICPDCVDNVVRRTPFRREFKRVHDMEPEYPKKCALGDPWFRIAWLLALQEKRDDLSLIRALASVNNEEKPCPDKHRAHRPWFSLPSKYGDGFISNLHVCQRCVRCVEVLMPSLRGVWQREPPTTPAPTKHLCTLRTSSRRFPKYLDALLDIHATVQRRGGVLPDLTPFADLAQANAWKAECQHDTPLLNAMWHVIPGVPELTVCEECYDEVVWPAARAGSKLASLVTGALQYVEGAHEVGVVGGDPMGDAAASTESMDEGRSCQLYSARMRRAWARACRDEDAGPFLRRVRERRQAEREIGARYRRIKMYLEQVEKGGGSSRDREVVERLEEELDRCRREWKEWE